jgi:hypothetical protein
VTVRWLTGSFRSLRLLGLVTGEGRWSLWASIADVAVGGREMDSRELALLRLAAESEDHVGELEAIVDLEGLMTVGSAAQPVVHPAVTEVRMQRTVIRQFLAGLALEGAPAAMSQASLRARNASRARWQRRDELEQHRPCARGAS